MNPHEIFGIVVRTIGIGLLVQSTISLAAVFGAPIILIAVFFEAAIGCLLFFAADLIVRAAYERRPWDDMEPPMAQ